MGTKTISLEPSRRLAYSLASESTSERRERVKTLKNILGIVLASVVAVFAYQFIGSRALDRRVEETERRVEDQKTRIEGIAVQTGRQSAALKEQEAKLATQGEDLVEVKKRLAAAEERLKGLGSAAQEDRVRLAGLKKEIEELQARCVELERSRSEIDQVGREMKRQLQRDIELDRRLTNIEKKLGIERPQP